MNSASVATVAVARATQLGDAWIEAKRKVGTAALVIATAALSLFGTAPARAEPRSSRQFELEWRAPPSCPDRSYALGAIDQALGAPDARVHSHAVVRVTIDEIAPDRWTTDIWMYDAAGSGERSIEGTSCEQVTQAATLVIALALASSAGSEPVVLETKAPKASEPLRFTLGLRGVGDLGSLPEPALGFALVLALQSRQLRVEAEAAGWLPSRVQTAQGADSGGNFRLFAGAVRGCLDLLTAANSGGLAFGPCASAEFGVTAGSGYGLEIRRTPRVFWGSALFGLSARFLTAAPLWFGAQIDAGIPWLRPAWQVDDVGTLFRPSALIGRAGLVVGWQFL